MKTNNISLVLVFGIGIIVLFYLYNLGTFQVGYVTPTITPTSSITQTSVKTPTFSTIQIFATETAIATQTITSTPYIVVYPGFLNCRSAPDVTSAVLFTIRGHQFTIIGQNESGNWLFIAVENKRCWIFGDVPFLNINGTNIPTIVVGFTPSPTKP